MKYKIIFCLATFIVQSTLSAQGTFPIPHSGIPDKAIDIFIFLVLVLVPLYTLLLILKITADNKLRNRLMEKGMSEELIRAMMLNSKQKIRNEGLKWALLFGFTGIALAICNVINFGYLTFAILFIAIAFALLIYLRITDKNSTS